MDAVTLGITTRSTEMLPRAQRSWSRCAASVVALFLVAAAPGCCCEGVGAPSLITNPEQYFEQYHNAGPEEQRRVENTVHDEMLRLVVNPMTSPFSRLPSWHLRGHFSSYQAAVVQPGTGHHGWLSKRGSSHDAGDDRTEAWFAHVCATVPELAASFLPDEYTAARALDEARRNGASGEAPPLASLLLTCESGAAPRRVYERLEDWGAVGRARDAEQGQGFAAEYARQAQAALGALVAGGDDSLARALQAQAQRGGDGAVGALRTLLARSEDDAARFHLPAFLRAELALSLDPCGATQDPADAHDPRGNPAGDAARRARAARGRLAVAEACGGQAWLASVLGAVGTGGMGSADKSSGARGKAKKNGRRRKGGERVKAEGAVQE